MPELPEVETIRRQMEEKLRGARIKNVAVRYGGRLFPSANEFIRACEEATLVRFDRRAKLLLMHLDSGHTVLVHLKMTGKFVLHQTPAEPTKHTHLVFSLADGRELHFEDIRKFGYLKAVRTEALQEEIFARESYGPEPLAADFTEAVFEERLKRKKAKQVKPILMDQTCIAGIGNIYADEACFLANIRPTRRVASLTKIELHRLYEGVRSVLLASLRHGGASANNYRNLFDEKGDSVRYFAVYGRTGDPCHACGTEITRIRIGTRSAHYCAKCQK